MDIKIKKAKLNNENCLEAVYIDAEGNEIALKGNHEVHLDLRSRLSELKPYFTELTEQKEEDSIDWEHLGNDWNKELMKQISVSSVTLSGNGSTLVILSGKRILLTRKVLNLNTPAVEFGDDSIEHIDSLEIAVNAFLYEVEQYILHGKYNTDGTIDFGDEKVEGDAADPFGEAEATIDVAIPA